MSLEQVLTGAPENTERPDVAPEAPEAAPEAPVTPEQVEKPAEPTAAPTGQTVPLQALQDERRKRQELEHKLAQQQQPQQEQPQGFWEDPVQAVNSTVSKVQLQMLQRELNRSEYYARKQYPDYDEKFEIFSQLVAENPNLKMQMLQAPEPAEFVYSTAKNHALFAQAGSIEQIREKIRAEERARVEAEYKAKAEAEAKKRDAIPETLTDVQSGSVREAAFAGPTPLKDILK